MSRYLNQLRPADQSATTIFTAASETEIIKLFVCNTTGTAAKYRVFHDDDGSTYDQSNALYYDESISPNTTECPLQSQGVGAGLSVSANGTIGVRSDTTNALTFTIYGNPILNR